MTISVPIPGPLRPARFIDRPNRFVLRAVLEPDEETVTAHIPDPGRLEDILAPGQRVWLRPAPEAKRSTRWSAVLVSHEAAGLVSVDTLLPNRLVTRALEREAIEELDGWHLVQAEAAIGRSRFDFLLERVSGEKLVLEVKGVSMVTNGVGLFPDAPSERATRHLTELSEIAARPGWYAAAMFVVQRNDAERVMAAHHIDPAFGEALADAKQNGVRLIGRRCSLTLEEVVMGLPIPVKAHRRG